MDRPIRNSAKALIIKDGCMAAVKIDDDGDVFYIMPGGGQNPDELLPEAAIRECAEELGLKVAVKELAFVIESAKGQPFHRVDLVFLCEHVAAIGAPATRDRNQVGVDWLPIDGLIDQPLYPSKLRQQIANLYHGLPHDIYLGNEDMGS